MTERSARRRPSSSPGPTPGSAAPPRGAGRPRRDPVPGLPQRGQSPAGHGADHRDHRQRPASTCSTLDLADLASVRACADAFLATGAPLHVLVNNAGLAGKRGLTASRLRAGLRDQPRRAVPAHQPAAGPPARQRPGPDRHRRLRRPLPRGRDRLRRRPPAHAHPHGVSRVQRLQARQRPPRPGARPPAAAASGVTTYALHPGVIASDVWREVPWPIRPADEAPHALACRGRPDPGLLRHRARGGRPTAASTTTTAAPRSPERRSPRRLPRSCGSAATPGPTASAERVGDDVAVAGRQAPRPGRDVHAVATASAREGQPRSRRVAARGRSGPATARSARSWRCRPGSGARRRPGPARRAPAGAAGARPRRGASPGRTPSARMRHPRRRGRRARPGSPSADAMGGSRSPTAGSRGTPAAPRRHSTSLRSPPSSAPAADGRGRRTRALRTRLDSASQGRPAPLPSKRRSSTRVNDPTAGHDSPGPATTGRESTNVTRRATARRPVTELSGNAGPPTRSTLTEMRRAAAGTTSCGERGISHWAKASARMAVPPPVAAVTPTPIPRCTISPAIGAYVKVANHATVVPFCPPVPVPATCAPAGRWLLIQSKTVRGSPATRQNRCASATWIVRHAGCGGAQPQ